ncbi:MAG: TetR/AcrR family transcriptional regulator [Clostridiales bacterium]|nr:TetR/AcrR family transcriptional regulator [Clostridiales bacterium]
MCPKVSEEYMENKRRSIVEAAYQVCLRKPVEMVTMTDVIEQTGLSQGGIYRFYKDLDEILSDMISKMRTDYNIIDRFDQVIADKDASFEDVVRRICAILGDVMAEHLMDIQKINFDLTVLAINEPERAAKIMGSLQGKGNIEHIVNISKPLLMEACRKNSLRPAADPGQIFTFISSAYVGIETNCILTACYGKGKAQTKCDPRALFDTLATTMIMLFGGKV